MLTTASKLKPTGISKVYIDFVPPSACPELHCVGPGSGLRLGSRVSWLVVRHDVRVTKNGGVRVLNRNHIFVIAASVYCVLEL